MRRCQSGEEAAVDAFLAGHSATSMFLRGNLALHGLAGSSHIHATAYYRLPDHGPIRAVLGVTNAGMVLCQAPDGVTDDIVRTLNGQTITGFSGAADQIDTLIAALGLNGRDWRADLLEPLMWLDLSELQAPPVDSILRPPGPLDTGLLTGWFLSYFTDTGIAPADPARALALAQDRARMTAEGQGGVRLLLDQAGEAVAMAGLNARAGGTVQVAGVYVPAPLRGRGLGRAITGAILAEARAAGETGAVLFANNSPAERSYRALGFTRIGQYRIAFLANPERIALP